ncbi:hypothetical protein [Amycolatopsis sp. NPDC059657]|uniref:hypothetical protein n=1 Tax=Amycolatopsis sp. NPDC059657 TaxID=3346899 RepID=UPI00366EB113
MSKTSGRKTAKRKGPHARVMRVQMSEAELASAATGGGAREPRGHLAKPRRLKSDAEAIGTLLESQEVTPDLLVELLLPLLWLDHAAGAPGNLCVSGTMILHHAFAHLGIASDVHSVEVMIDDEQTGQHVVYGRMDPCWVEDAFHGHCVLSLPRSRRLIDPAIEQFPEVKRGNLPLVGRTVLTGSEQPEVNEALLRGELLPHGMMVAKRRNQRFYYTAVGEEYARAAWESPRAGEDAERYRAAGLNIASHALSLMRLPEVVDRVRQAQYPKINAFLDVIGDAPIATDAVGDFYVTLGGQRLRIDEIRLPEEANDATPDTATPIPHVVVMNEKKIRAVMEEVETAVQLHVTTPHELGGGSLPVAVFEPPTVVGVASRSTGQTQELQIENIVLAGFGRYSPNATAHVPRLPTWSVRQTATGLELWDHGGVWARAQVTLDGEWIEAAEKYGRIFAVYGLMCGVQKADEQLYAECDHMLQLQAACRNGFVAAATVSWRWPSSSATWARRDRETPGDR